MFALLASLLHQPPRSRAAFSLRDALSACQRGCATSTTTAQMHPGQCGPHWNAILHRRSGWMPFCSHK